MTWPPRRVTETVSGIRHDIYSIKPDPRVVETWCAKAIALVGAKHKGQAVQCEPCKDAMAI